PRAHEPFRSDGAPDRVSARPGHQPCDRARACRDAGRRRAQGSLGRDRRHAQVRVAPAASESRAIQPAREVLSPARGEARMGAPARPDEVMLRELRVRDLALVAESRVQFGPGLNLLTGETGSGKSLIVDALGLTLGGRGGADQVRHGAEKATIESVFESGGTSVVLQRELGKRGSARIDGRPANPGQLRELGRGLVALHGQHEHQALLDSDTQTDLLDAYGGAVELRAGVAAAHPAWTGKVNPLADLEGLCSRGERDRGFLRWQLDELRHADPHPGEDAELAAERAAVRHAARLAELGHEAMSALQEDALARASSALGAAAELDPRLGEQAA